MADTNDTITRVVPQDGWSPIICHRVPITQTITNIVGDAGSNEIYEGGSIKNFHAKIDWEDQYGGSRVPADIITESSDDYGKTWTMNEVQEHAEGSFELDYEGHERDFEVRLNGTSLYIRYRWLMNGQEITDTDGSFEHAITITDYPTRLEVDAHYADNFGGHEIGAPIFNSAKIFYKSGAVDDTKTKGAFTKPVQATLWADKDGWQTQTWSYTENGHTVTAQVGARITALRDVKIEAELVIPYTAFPPHWGPEDGKDYWCGLKNEDDTDPILIFREGAVVSKSNLLVTMTRNDGSTYEATDYWMPNNYALGRGKQSVTVQKGSLSTTLPVTVAYSTKVEVGNVSGSTFTKSSFYEYGEYVEPTHYNVHYECYDGTEGFDEVAEIEGEWEGKIESNTSCKIYTGKIDDTEGYTLRLYKVDGITDADISGDEYVLLTEEGIEYYLFTKEYILTNLQEAYIGEDIEEGFYVYHEIGPDGNIFDASTDNGFPYYGNLYHKNEEGEKGEPIESPFEVASCGEYGSEVGILTLGSKKYLYRAGLEPIDEENYLFIKDFKDVPFNYGLVNCYEPQWEEPVELIEAKYSDSVTGLYAYPVETPTGLSSSFDIIDGVRVQGYALLPSAPSTMKGVISSEVLSQVIDNADEGYYLITTTSTIDKNADIKYADGTDVVLIVEGGSEGVKSFNLKVLNTGDSYPYTDEVLDLNGAFTENGNYQIYYHDVGDGWDFWDYLNISKLGDLEDWLKSYYYNFDAEDNWYICNETTNVTEGSKAYVVYGTEGNKYYINDDGTRVDLQ